MKKLVLFISSCLFCTVSYLNAMEEQQDLEFTGLPTEIPYNIIKTMIPEKIEDSSQIVDFIKTLARFLMTHKHYYFLIQDEGFLNFVAKKLEKRVSNSDSRIISEAFDQIQDKKINKQFKLLLSKALERSIAKIYNELVEAKRNNDLKKRDALLRKVVQSESEFNTLLHYAMKEKSHDMIDYILLHGSVFNIEKYGAEALQIAARQWKHQTVSALLKRKVNVEIKDIYDRTPLLMATSIPFRSRQGLLEYQLKTVQALLKNGAHVNAQDKFGNTALIYAVKDNNPGLVFFLLRYNPDISIKNKERKTAIEIAHDKSNEKIIKLLEDYKNQ